MVSSPSPPASPSPSATAQAQTQSNQQTALFQAGLNNVNQNTPLGSISYNTNPGQTDENGNVITMPSTTSNITLNPLVQQDLDATLGAAAQEAQLAQQYEGQVANTMSKPYDLNSVGAVPQANAAYQQQIMNNMNALQQPYIDRSNEQLQAQLANQGITQGSEAYHNAMLDQANSLNNLQQQNVQNATAQEQAQYAMAMQNYGQQLQNYSQNYTMPLNQLTALQSGSQVSQPTFSQPAGTSVSPTNVAGIYNQAYQNQLGAYNTQVAQQNQMMGGLFGLGGSLGAAAIMSDRRLKANIKHIGKTAQGIPVYRYHYIWDKKTQHMGVMADEIEKIIPEAVIVGSDGYKRVDYRKVL